MQHGRQDVTCAPRRVAPRRPQPRGACGRSVAQEADWPRLAEAGRGWPRLAEAGGRPGHD
eukprot:scaffold81319_cov72-Phaeocystis_antarctica.AAC.1